MQRTEWVINKPVFDVLKACVINGWQLGKLPINPKDISLLPKPFDIATNKEAKPNEKGSIWCLQREQQSLNLSS